MNGRAGKSARKLAEHRMRLRSAVTDTGPTASDNPPGHATAVRCAYYGSKAYKSPAERRPSKGGKVHS
jgi:hypothetical protein